MQLQLEELQNAYKMNREKLDTMLQIALLQKDTADKAAKEKAAQPSPASSSKSRKGLSDVASKRKAK